MKSGTTPQRSIISPAATKPSGAARVLIEITAVITIARSSSGVREVRTERREQILEAARRCFAGHGYQGATVVRLEEATGLSRGAIFNYFDSKEDLFLELAARDNERLVQLWVEKGWEKTLREVVHEDPDWIGVYMEMGRKIRTDPEFKRRYEARTQESLAPPLLEHVRAEQKRGAFRADALAEQIAGFIGLVANGVAVQPEPGSRSGTWTP